MCGRYVAISDPEHLAEYFHADTVTASSDRSYNVAPTMSVPALIDHDDERRLGALSWGYVPYWSKNPKKPPRPINARLDKVLSNRMFAESFGQRRCILPADGFYEWQVTGEDASGKPIKQAWYIHEPEEQPLAFAGIWSSWKSKDVAEGDEPDRIHSAAILTTDARGKMVDLHHRMPLILPSRLWDEWLHGDVEPEALQLTLTGLEAPALNARAVSSLVNNVRNDSADLLTAI